MVQNVLNFEKVIESYRNDGNISIFITGSNSYLYSLFNFKMKKYKTER